MVLQVHFAPTTHDPLHYQQLIFYVLTILEVLRAISYIYAYLYIDANGPPTPEPEPTPTPDDEIKPVKADVETPQLNMLQPVYPGEIEKLIANNQIIFPATQPAMNYQAPVLPEYQAPVEAVVEETKETEVYPLIAEEPVEYTPPSYP